MRLIDADALIDALVNACNNDHFKFFPVWIEKQIDAQPTVTMPKEQDAVEPINSYGTFRCGNCRNIVGYDDGHWRGYQNNFCSKCGKAVKWNE